MSGLRYGDKTYKLIGMLREVRGKMKAGWSEEIYHQATVELLQDKNIPVLSKPRRSLVHRGEEVHVFVPDLIVWDTIFLELKVLPFDVKFAGEHYAQLIHYLKFWGKTVGLLVNFAPPSLIVKRVIWDKPPLVTVEQYDEIRPFLNEADRTCLLQVRQVILSIAEQYGLGYPESIYRQVLAIEMEYHRFRCSGEIEIPAYWQGKPIGTQKAPLLLIAEKYLIHVRSLLKFPTEYDFVRTKTYLANLKLQFGLVVNFGSKELQIFGVRSE